MTSPLTLDKGSYGLFIDNNDMQYKYILGHQMKYCLSDSVQSYILQNRKLGE